MEGWIKLHRNILGWQWATSANHFALFTVLLLRANFKESKWRKHTIKPGQLVTGRKQLSDWTGLTEMQIRVVLRDLKESGEVNQQTTSKFSIITITNWERYQQDNQQITNKQPADNQQITTSKNANNANNGKNDNKLLLADSFTPSFFTEVIDAPEKNLPTEKIKGKRKGLAHSPLSILFKPEDSIQSWLLTGSLEAHQELLGKYSHHVLAEEIKKAFIWQCENKARNAGIFLLTWMSNKKTTAFMPNSAQKRFSGRGAGIEPSEQNPTGNPYIQEAIDKGLIA